MSMARELENLLRGIAAKQAVQGKQPVRPATAPPVEAEILEAELVSDWQRDAADQPIHCLGADDVVQHASPWGGDAGRVDESLEAAIHGKFNHTLSQLNDVYADKSEAGESPAEPPPIDVAAMLRNPQSLRDAIILSEILRRPQDRW